MSNKSSSTDNDQKIMLIAQIKEEFTQSLDALTSQFNSGAFNDQDQQATSNQVLLTSQMLNAGSSQLNSGAINDQDQQATSNQVLLTSQMLNAGSSQLNSGAINDQDQQAASNQDLDDHHQAMNEELSDDSVDEYKFKAIDDFIEEMEKRSEQKEEENQRLIQENNCMIQENQRLIKENSMFQLDQAFGITVAQHQASGPHQTSGLSVAQELIKAQDENRLLKDQVRTLRTTLAERNRLIQGGDKNT